jgi:hypothetical protein
MSKYDVQLGGAALGRVREHDAGGWPEFEITLTYYVADTEDLDAAHRAALDFFGEADYPEGVDLP